jgi:hypothetical protein
MVVALAYAIFTPVERRSQFFVSFKQLFRMSFINFWSWANGKKSSGPKRPKVGTWIFRLTALWVFAMSYIFQFFCFFVFKRAPRTGLARLIIGAVKKMPRFSEGDGQEITSTRDVSLK